MLRDVRTCESSIDGSVWTGLETNLVNTALWQSNLGEVLLGRRGAVHGVWAASGEGTGRGVEGEQPWTNWRGRAELDGSEPDKLEGKSEVFVDRFRACRVLGEVRG